MLGRKRSCGVEALVLVPGTIACELSSSTADKAPDHADRLAGNRSALRRYFCSLSIHMLMATLSVSVSFFVRTDSHRQYHEKNQLKL